MELRWLGCAGYEIITEQGTVLYVDPWLTSHAFHAPISVSDIKRADAILLTHAHFDHDEDVWEIMKNTGASLLASQQEIDVLNQIERLPKDQLRPVQWEDTVQIQGCKIYVTKAKHVTRAQLEASYLGRARTRSKRPDAEIRATMEILPKGFCVTTENGLRLWVLGPCGHTIPETTTYSDALRPQIAVVQVPPALEEAVGVANVKMMYKNGVGPSILLPTHHDKTSEDAPIEADIDLFTTLVHQIYPEVKILNPKLGQYYQFDLQYR
jgi:L-ascorbate metabolism protein UlaG (beta-lactamase superfamily)